MISSGSLIAFDLDDTLYKERDYLRSGHHVLARTLAEATGMSEESLFGIISANHPRGIEAAASWLASHGVEMPFTVDALVEIYRAHKPDISLSPGVDSKLASLRDAGHSLVLITDGSSVHQRAKIDALGLHRYFEPEAILISGETGGDKHTPVSFRLAEQLYGECTSHRFYVGDNLAKDFIHPNLRGWTSVMLADTAGVNVFPQRPADWPAVNRPAITISNISLL